ISSGPMDGGAKGTDARRCDGATVRECEGAGATVRRCEEAAINLDAPLCNVNSPVPASRRRPPFSFSLGICRGWGRGPTRSLSAPRHRGRVAGPLGGKGPVQLDYVL